MSEFQSRLKRLEQAAAEQNRAAPDTQPPFDHDRHRKLYLRWREDAEQRHTGPHRHRAIMGEYLERLRAVRGMNHA